MEELDMPLFQVKPAVDSTESTNEKVSFIFPDINEAKEDIKLEMHQICRGCLTLTEVANMQEIFIEGIAIVVVYEDLLKIKVEDEDVPAMMCASCALELSKIGKFINSLKQSYEILTTASKEIEKLSKERNLDKYNLMKTKILRNVIKNEFVESCLEEVNSVEVEQKNEDNHLSDDGLSDNNFSLPNNIESSDDETPLSERFKIDVNKSKEDTKVTKKTREINIENKMPRKRGRRRKENLENLPVNNTVLINDKPMNASQTMKRLNSYDTCPVCCRKIGNFLKHVQTVHCVDWNDSRCLICSYQNMEKDKLVEHCKECIRKELKVENVDQEKREELKLEWHEEVDYTAEPDDEFDEPERVDPKYYIQYEGSEEMEHSKGQINKKRGRSKKFSCNKCDDKDFKPYEEIELHLKTAHHNESSCILCEQEFTNFFSLLYHMMVKHGKLKCCRLCLVSFSNADELNAHYQSEEHNTKCTVCGEQFKNRKAVYEHRRKRHLNPHLEHQKYKCPECPKEFSNQNNIKRHISVAHKDLRFLCDSCGQSYTTKRNLKLHIMKFHEGIEVKHKNTKKNFFCEACGKELKIFHKYAIALHIAKHKGHHFVCRKCYESFPSEEIFKQHVEDLGHQLYECDQCQSQFVREENFKIHLKNHDAPGWNKNMFATWGKSAKLRNEKGEFVCSYCPKVFKDKQRLDNHVRVHTNERPYKCHVCSKGFKTWIHRKTHVDIHLGIKKWICRYCSKAFTNSCTLKGHEMIHTGERPHRCPECKKGFITMSAMKKHRMIHFRTGSSGAGKKEKVVLKEDVKTDSDHEENADFMYKYGQMFTGSDVSYESFTDPPKEPSVSLVSIEKELSC